MPRSSLTVPAVFALLSTLLSGCSAGKPSGEGFCAALSVDEVADVIDSPGEGVLSEDGCRWSSTVNATYYANFNDISQSLVDRNEPYSETVGGLGDKALFRSTAASDYIDNSMFVVQNGLGYVLTVRGPNLITSPTMAELARTAVDRL